MQTDKNPVDGLLPGRWPTENTIVARDATAVAGVCHAATCLLSTHACEGPKSKTGA